MSESNLSLTRRQLIQAGGVYMGLGPDVSLYPANETTLLELCLDSALRSFYNPVPIPGETTPHVWSFLTPIYDVPITSAAVDYNLPDDFAHFVDSRIYLSADSDSWQEIKLANVSRILSLRQRDTSVVSGFPMYAAQAVRQQQQGAPTRFKLMVWPNPDGDYTLRFQYRSNPFQITDDSWYPLGGQPHAETLREAMLAAVERDVDEVVGHHNQMFLARLIASVAEDRRATGPEYFGYNADRSRTTRIFDRLGTNIVTINGITPD